MYTKEVKLLIEKKLLANKRTDRGVTVIALAVIIIVLLILAGVGINAISGDNGIIKRAGDAKEASNSAQEKEILQESAVRAMEKSPEGDVEKQYLEEELNIYPGSSKYTSTTTDDGIEVTFTDSNNKYIVKPDGRVTPKT